MPKPKIARHIFELDSIPHNFYGKAPQGIITTSNKISMVMHSPRLANKLLMRHHCFSLMATSCPHVYLKSIYFPLQSLMITNIFTNGIMRYNN
jgi:hypothetical protein